MKNSKAKIIVGIILAREKGITVLIIQINYTISHTMIVIMVHLVVTKEMDFITMANIDLHHGEVEDDITSQDLMVEKASLRNEGMGETFGNEGNKTDHQTDQKFNCKVPSGYDTKIGPHTGSDVAQVTEDYQPPDPEYWEEIMPQFDLDGATSEADLIVEEVGCNMIEPESENDESQSDEESCSVKFNCQSCTTTQSDTPLHAEQLKINEFSSRAEDLSVKACVQMERQ